MPEATSCFAMSRRAAMKGAASAGLVLTFSIAGCGELDEQSQTSTVNGWFRIAPSGEVTIYVNSTDLGQGSQSGMAQVMADELGVGWQFVRVAQAPIEKEFFCDGDYYTGGSDAIAVNWTNIRHVAAAARSMLVAAAAEKWGVTPANCTAADGLVRHPSGARTATYGELAPLAAKLAPPRNPVVKSPAEWTLIGRSLPRIDIPPKVDGRALYALDVKLPGMLNAAISQCPIYGGRLASMNEQAALKVLGVRKIVRIPRLAIPLYPNVQMQDSVAVVASYHWQATKGLERLAPKWLPPDGAAVSTKSLIENLHQDVSRNATPQTTLFTVVRKEDSEADQKEKIDRAFASPDRIVEAEYEVPFLAHATMEPMSAVARWHRGKVEIWTGTQAQLSLKQVISRQFQIAESDIAVNTTVAGGGFGRRYYPDSALQAAYIARQMNAPVKVVWSRSEDLQHDVYRPPAVARFSAAISKEGKVEAVRMQQARICRMAAENRYIGLRYAWPAFLANFTVRKAPVSWGAWRSVEDTPQFFFIESFVDELAHATGTDPIAYRKTLLSREPRAVRVLDALAKLSDWGTPLPAGHGRGVALCYRGGPVAAQVAEVAVSGNTVKVERVICAFDCGTSIIPDSIVAQGEGSIIFGLSAALFGEITLKDGRVVQENFDGYPVVKLANCPAIEVHIVNTPGAPIAGVGEPMTAPIAPAVTNAIFAATGTRVRKLPLTACGMNVSA